MPPRLRPAGLAALLLACPPAPATTDTDTTTDATGGSTTTTAPTTGAAPDPDLPIACDTYAPACPEGQKCSPYSAGAGSWDALRCVPLDPDPGHAGDPCTVADSQTSGRDTCDQGSMCWNIDPETLTGTCVPFCDGAPEAPGCPDASTCVITNDEVLNLCLPTCDPLQQDCTAGGDLCIASPNDNFVCVPDESGDQGQAFDACEAVNDCDAGLVCAESSHASECAPAEPYCCLPFCDLSAPPSCPGAMQICISYFEMAAAPPGFEDVGYCTLPP